MTETQRLSLIPNYCTAPIFGPFLLRPTGWMHHDAIWYSGRPRPRPYCARWGPSFPQKRGQSQFSAHVRCGRTAGWSKMSLEVDLGLVDRVRWGLGTQLPLKKGAGHSHPTHFRPMSIVAKRLDGSRCHLVWR